MGVFINMNANGLQVWHVAVRYSNLCWFLIWLIC